MCAYRKFCDRHFNSFFSKQKFSSQKKALLNFFQMISFFEILCSSDDFIIRNLSESCRQILMEMMYSIPVGSKMLYSMCCRQFAEKILDIIYYKCVDSKIELDSLLVLNYRSLWEDGIRKRGTLADKLTHPKNESEKYFKERIEDINSIFRIESDVVHKKNSGYNTTEYLSQIVEKGSEYEESEILRREKAFFRCVIDVLPRILKLDIEKMTMSQRKQYLDIIRYLRKDALYLYNKDEIIKCYKSKVRH